MNSRLMNLLGVSLVLCLVIGLTLIPVSNVNAYYGGYGGYGGYSPLTSGYGYAGYASPYYPSSYSSFGSLGGTGLGFATGGLYGGLYGGSGGLYGGLYGGYGGLYGGLSGGYGGLGLYGGLMGGLYGGLGLGLMGGLYGGLMGGLSSMYSSPFGAQNLYYPVQTTGGLTYQVPFMQIAPLLGIAGLYNQLFPNMFNPQPSLPPVVNVTTPATQFVTFPTPVGTISVT
jgi:hypothetical protein